MDGGRRGRGRGPGRPQGNYPRHNQPHGGPRPEGPRRDGFPGEQGRGAFNGPFGQGRGVCNAPGGRGRGGNNNAEGVPQRPRQPREMTYERLAELSTKEPAEVLITLRDGNSGFTEVLNASRFGNDILLAIVTVTAKACKSTLHRHNLMALITDVVNSKLASEHLPKYLNRVPYMVDFEEKVAFMEKIAPPLKIFLKAAIQSVPTLANEKLELCVTTFQTSFGTVLQQLPTTVAAKYQEMLTELEDMRKVIMRPVEELSKKISELVLVQAGDPPENFREIQIAPTTEELRGEVDPFLRENIVVGKYRDGAHYLDVQFRLLREDFVGPLREGITKYRELVGAASAGGVAAKALAAMKELRIYRRVRLASQESTGSGMVFILQLDVAVLGNIKWENSKRLLTGSLLCISPDDFATLALAVVVKRDVTQLRKGLLSVQIMQGRTVIESPNARGFEFVVAESPAYFEAFSPILKGLQALDDDKLPFSKYIIEVNTNMAAPKYMTSNTRYDLSPLLKRDEGNPILRHGMAQPRFVPIQHLDLWPGKDELGLDTSQYRALQGALTRELAIIQGPPGTGKTFLGLKVVEMLIHNQNEWRQRVAPILTICFTNHALDQFLEGILEDVGERGIVRVGGRSKSEKLEPYNLNALRQKEENLKTIPRHIHQTSKHIRWRMKEVGKSMADMGTCVAKLRQKVINERNLQKYMTGEHLGQFQRMSYAYRTKSGIKVWLGGAITQEDLDTVDQEELHPLDAEAERIAANNPNVAEEEEVEEDFDENQRILDEGDPWDPLRRYGFLHNYSSDEDLPPTQVVYAEGWQIQGGQKNFNKILKKQMKRMDVMTDREAERVGNLDTLFPRDRWRLYRYWAFKMRDEYQTRLEILQRDYEGIYRELKEVEMEENTYIIRTAKVVGMTTTGAAKYQSVLQAIKPQIVIVEEAAEVFEAHILTALTEECQHLILIGDHQQLRPNPTVYKLAKRYNLDVSLFERMLKNGIPYESLKLQHRMRPQIARLLVPNIYKDLLNHPSVEDRPQIKGVGHNVFFVNHDIRERNVADSTSKENLFEADYATALCRHLLLQGYEGEQITVLTTYIGQMYQLKSRMKNPLFAGVRTTVVDNYQGEENDIIILSLVRSNEESKIGFLKVENRVCVALSRARNGLFAIGNFDFLVENGGAVWNPIVNHLTRAELIGPALKLVCQNHSNTTIEAKSAADFKQAPEGGCIRPCEYRLPCGHQCSLVCHNYDPEHATEKTRCPKPCAKITCQRGHKCPKLCYEDCGKCFERVDVILSGCGHPAKISCCMDIAKARCMEKCPRYLGCGHGCCRSCGEPCPDACIALITIQGECGHEVKMPCFKKDDQALVKQRCQAKCDQVLDCEHCCRGSCGGCYQGRFHKRCGEKCGRVLVCGHACKVPCAVVCPPCTGPCENRCVHSKCPNQCGVPCKPCVEQCAWHCAHFQCTKLCWEQCDRQPCNRPCHKTLPCGHQCIGMCGEPCPKKCRVCNRDEVCEILFGDEDAEDARFVELEDCGHVVEVIGMDRWMKEKREGSNEILMKGCPKCKTVVRRSLRYGNQIKRILNDVVEIKKRVFGQVDRKDQLTREILDKCISSYALLNPQIHQKIRDSLKRSMIPGSEYTLLENLANVLKEVGKIHTAASKLKESQIIISQLTEIKDWILDMIPSGHKPCGSEQQLKEFVLELRKVNLHRKLLEIPTKGHLNDKAKSVFNHAMSLVTSRQPFTDVTAMYLEERLKEIQKLQTGLGITDEERLQILKAIRMSPGHWFKCPNGHIYVITECGGAMQEGKCNECKATIGGASHRLRDDNQPAPEMDNSRRPHYPTLGPMHLRDPRF